MSHNQAGAIMALLLIGVWVALVAGLIVHPRYRLLAWAVAAACAAPAFIMLWITAIGG